MSDELADAVTIRRIAENQSVFRSANERIEGTALGLEIVLHALPLICECSDRTCTELLRLTMPEYEHIRQNPRRFFVAPGHQQVAVGLGAAVVVETRDDVVIVDKIGVAGDIAEETHGLDVSPDDVIPWP